MITGNQILYRTLSCRTGRLTLAAKPADPVRVLMLILLAGTGLGTLLCCKFPDAAQLPLLTQGLAVQGDLRTLWDVFCTAALPLLLLLGGVMLCGGWSYGQPFLLLLLLLRGSAIGLAAADCFRTYGLRQGLLNVSTIILPFAFVSALLLIFPVRDALSLACRITAYLIKGNADPEIRAGQHKLLSSVLRAMLLTIPAAGLHTLLIFAADRSALLQL